MFSRKGPDGEPVRGLTLYQKLGIAAGGIGALGFGTGIGAGIVLDQTILRSGVVFTDTGKTEQQASWEMNIHLAQEIKKVHGRDGAVALLAQVREGEEGRRVFKQIMENTKKMGKELSYLIIANESQFSHSRFINGDKVIEHGSEDFQVYTRDQMRDLLSGVPQGDNDWIGYKYEGYNQVDPQLYTEQLGSMLLVIPDAQLPSDRFVFAFSKRTSDKKWVEQPIDAFEVLVEGQSFIIVSLESFDPKKPVEGVNAQTPIYDTYVVFVTDINGQPVIWKAAREPHWGTNIKES